MISPSAKRSEWPHAAATEPEVDPGQFEWESRPHYEIRGRLSGTNWPTSSHSICPSLLRGTAAEQVQWDRTPPPGWSTHPLGCSAGCGRGGRAGRARRGAGPASGLSAAMRPVSGPPHSLATNRIGIRDLVRHAHRRWADGGGCAVRMQGGRRADLASTTVAKRGSCVNGRCRQWILRQRSLRPRWILRGEWLLHLQGVVRPTRPGVLRTREGDVLHRPKAGSGRRA